VPAPNDRPDAALAKRCRRKDNPLFEESEAIILVVEDDEEVRTLMKATLEDLNYQVISKTDGPSALKSCIATSISICFSPTSSCRAA
tara:strand:+ start:55 stop:315 length:261 start_codon:yes stop_codon:yes gene_type:complete